MAGEKHLPYFLLLDALRQPGCAICRRAEESALDSLRHTLHELVTDGRFRDRLLKGGGFCPEHAWELTDQRDLLGVTILSRDQVESFREQVRRAGESRRPLTAPVVDCPACEVREETASAALTVFLRHLADTEIQDAFASSDGLCRRHFSKAAEGAAGDLRRLLVELQERALARLLEQLDELIRKQDHRFRDEPVGVEADSWLRATASLAGVDTRRLGRPRSRSLPLQKRKRPETGS